MDIRIEADRDGLTVGEVLKKQLKISARFLTKLKYASEDGITVNGSHVTVRYRLHQGDLLQIALEDRTSTETVSPVSLPLDTVYEDEFLMVVNKPAQMPTHPSHGHLEDTLANALAYHFRQKEIPFVFRPVNRLDRNTSGLVLVAKDQLTSSLLYRSMVRGEIHKTYLALLDGVPASPEGVIDKYICRQKDSVICRVVCDPEEPGAMRSITRYRVLCSDGVHSLVEVFPETGRTHQIRVHFASIGCPVFGDDLYGSSCEALQRHALHAYALTFPHPQKAVPLTCRAPLPPELRALVVQFFGNEVILDDTAAATYP